MAPCTNYILDRTPRRAYQALASRLSESAGEACQDHCRAASMNDVTVGVPHQFDKEKSVEAVKRICALFEEMQLGAPEAMVALKSLVMTLEKNAGYFVMQEPKPAENENVN